MIPVYVTVAEFRARVRRAVDDTDAAWRRQWVAVPQREHEARGEEIAALRALVAELLVEGARLRALVAAMGGGS